MAPNRPRLEGRALSPRLARARIEAGLAVADVARLLHVDARTIPVWEAGLEPPAVARDAVAALIEDLEHGRVPRPRLTRLFGIVEGTRDEAAHLNRLLGERRRLSRQLFARTDLVSERACLAHEVFRVAVAAQSDEKSDALAARVDAAYQDMEDHLALIKQAVAHLRAQSRDALALRQQIRRKEAA